MTDMNENVVEEGKVQQKDPNWGAILSTVKDQLPDIDSDSEVSSITDGSDSESLVFQRKVTPMEEFNAEKDKITDEVNENAETDEHCNEDSSSLLFHRLNCRARRRNKNDLELIDLDLPLYDETALSSSRSTSVCSESRDINGNLILSPTSTASCDATSLAGLEQTRRFSEVKVETPESVLSLKALERIDFDDMLEGYSSPHLPPSSSLTSLPTPIADKDSESESAEGEPVQLMDQLVSLSSNQVGLRRGSDEAEMTKGNFLWKTRPREKPGEKDEPAIPNKTCSQGVSANIPTNSELTWSEPTTIFLDLRSNNEKNIKEELLKPKQESKEVPKVKKLTSSQGCSTSNTPNKTQPRILSRSSVTTDSTSDDDSGNDDDFEQWKIMRNTFKKNSTSDQVISLTTSIPSQKTSVDEIDPNKTIENCNSEKNKDPKLIAKGIPIVNANTNSEIINDVSRTEKVGDISKHILENPESEQSKKELREIAMRKIRVLKKKQKEIQGNADIHINGVDKVTTNGHCDEKPEVGIYASQRLKKSTSPATKKKDVETVPNSVAKNKSRGKSTVLFAEEPKKDVRDTTNIYRGNVTKSVPKKSSTTAIQTMESFPNNYMQKDVKKLVSDALNCSTTELQQAAANLIEEKKKQKNYAPVNDTKPSKWALTNSRDNYSILQNQRKQPPTSLQTSLCVKPAAVKEPVPTVSWETRNKFNNSLTQAFKETCPQKDSKHFPLLFDRETTYEPPLATIPPRFDATETQKMVLLTFQMTSPGCIVAHRPTAGNRLIPVDPSSTLSITYSLLLSWMLALIPDNLKKPHDPPQEDVFTIDSDIDPGTNSPLPDSKDDGSVNANLIEIPFNVISLHQVWQEETQTLATHAIVIPNFFYKPDNHNRRKKPKKENAFLQVVWHFLQSNRVQDVCPWHSRPESPILYTVQDIPICCATKPMSTYVTASNDPVLLQKELKRSPGFFWKMIKPDEQSASEMIHEVNNPLETSICLLQKDTFTYPVCLMDLIIRFQLACLDVVGLRLAYVTKRFLQTNMLSHGVRDNLDQVVPVVAMSVRGSSAIKRLISIIGPRDPVLARMTDQGSLNAIYGEQLSIRRGDISVPTEMNVFHCPRGVDRVNHQLSVWYGGRMGQEDEHALNSPVAKNNFLSEALLSPSKQTAKSNGLHSNGKQNGFNPNGKQTSLTPNGKANGKGKGKSRSNSTSSAIGDTDFSSHRVVSKYARNPHLVTSYPSRLCLLISARFPPQYLGDVISIIYDKGFSLEGLKRMVLNEKKAASLCIPSRYMVYFNPPQNLDGNLVGEYYEMDTWWLRPVTVFLLCRENASNHQAGLISSLQTDLMYRLVPHEDAQLQTVTLQCFHACPYNEVIGGVLGTICKIPDNELGSGVTPRSFSSDPELEQIVVLSLLGNQLISESGCILQTLLQGEFFLRGENDMESAYNSTSDTDDYASEFKGFELLGVKFLPRLSSHHAKELTPFEVGTRLWCDSISIIKGSPVLLCVLRRVDAFKVLRDALDISPPKINGKTSFNLNQMNRLMSTTPEITYRQVKTFFSDKELFSDNQCRPLLKYLPAPLQLTQYLHQMAVKSDGEEGAGESNSSGTNNKSSKKKKKNNAKSKESSLSFPCEGSIINTMLSWPQPLTSMLIIKPDAFPRHVVKILRRLYQEGFTVVAMKMIIISDDQAMQIMPSKYQKMPGERSVFCSHMTSAASLVICVQRSNAVRRLLDVAGPSDPREARRVERGYSHARGNWRAEFGIDEFSNAIHVSESYITACEELKLFFPDGLCCKETLELKMEHIPSPGHDNILCKDKMKGREIRSSSTLDINLYGIAGMEIQPICVVLSSTLMLAKSKTLPKSKVPSHATPPYVSVLEQLVQQGYEQCALRMAWLKHDQANFLIDAMGEKNLPERKELLSNLTNGPSLLLLLQRENGLILFDSIIGSCLKRQKLAEHNKHYLRTQTLQNTHTVVRYLFHRVEYHRSVVQIAHKMALEWRECNGN